MKYHNPIFDRLSEEKQRHILVTATLEFSRLGYKTANINVIAKKCGISVGALYKYFTTKENLFLSVCSEAVRQLSESLEKIEKSQKKFTEKIELILKTILKHSRKNRELINLYNEITTEANSDLATQLSFQMESLSAGYYRKLISQAKKEEVIPADTDVEMAAFTLDNIFMALQFSYASEYYRERMKIYVDGKIFEDDKRVLIETMNFIKQGLGISQ